VSATPDDDAGAEPGAEDSDPGSEGEAVPDSETDSRTGSPVGPEPDSDPGTGSDPASRAGPDRESLGDEVIEGLSIEYLLLCDAAQVVGAKLYIMGGGWDRLQLAQYPATLPVAIAVGVRVQWTETNRRHRLLIRGLTSDHDRELFRAEGEFEVGRPPGTPHGMSQLFQVAMNVPLQIPEPGSYTLEASVDDGAAVHALPFLAVASAQ